MISIIERIRDIICRPAGRKWKYAIAALAALAVGLNIYHRCDTPPYGFPFNELSDYFWGPIVDIARQWRLGHIEFWTRGVCGGISLLRRAFIPF